MLLILVRWEEVVRHIDVCECMRFCQRVTACGLFCNGFGLAIFWQFPAQLVILFVQPGRAQPVRGVSVAEPVILTIAKPCISLSPVCASRVRPN